MSTENWEHFFKPEVRTSGRRFYSEGSVSVSQPSDTEIQAYIRGSTPIKISLKSPSMASKLITADCTCPASKKGQLCKHIWATLLAVEEKKPEFFEDKEELQKREPLAAVEAEQTIKSKSTFKPQAKRPASEEQLEKQAAFKAKQADYRKAQYQKQKQRLKDKKPSKNKSHLQTVSLPDEVEAAVTYFSENGFPLEAPFKTESVQISKKKLSRIFHPDIGGSHHEIVELNKHSENLIAYIESK